MDLELLVSMKGALHVADNIAEEVAMFRSK